MLIKKIEGAPNDVFYFFVQIDYLPHNLCKNDYNDCNSLHVHIYPHSKTCCGAARQVEVKPSEGPVSTFPASNFSPLIPACFPEPDSC